MKEERKDYGIKTFFTLHKPYRYQVLIAGQLNENWTDWIDNLDCQLTTHPSGLTVTSLTGCFDQAALIGLLRKLYSLGFPLISITCFHDE